MLSASPAAAAASYPADRPAATGEIPVIEQSGYEALAAFRIEIRRFFAFSQNAIEGVGLAPAQYQAMLAIKAHRAADMSVTQLAAELFIKVQTAVELIDRMELAGLVTRARCTEDKRRAILSLTPTAERELEALAAMHLTQLQESVPDLIAILSRIAGSAAIASSRGI